ncbi:MAG TPA: hypothetical protein VD926_12405 [Acidimicrobiales bacterium]|nr:hypothetical protein [Acidimicrobiales bacterium]
MGWWMVVAPVLALEVVWVNWFLTRLRPRLRVELSRRLGVPVVDGYSGAWATAPGTGVARSALVAVADVTLLIGATLGPLAVVLVVLVALTA